jgi:hypothetical protein
MSVSAKSSTFHEIKSRLISENNFNHMQECICDSILVNFSLVIFKKTNLQSGGNTKTEISNPKDFSKSTHLKSFYGSVKRIKEYLCKSRELRCSVPTITAMNQSSYTFLVNMADD